MLLLARSPRLQRKFGIRKRDSVYPELLPFLGCLECAGDLVLRDGDVAPGDAIECGELVCVTCGACYTIRDGITDMLGSFTPRTPAQHVNDTALASWAYERLWRPFALTLLTGERFPYRRELPLVAALADAQRGGLFVDVACSNGLYARALTRAMHGAGHVVGVDYSLAMLHEARQRARNAGLRISYMRAMAQALPLRSSVAAGVVIGGSLNEIGDLDGCLAEVRRVLRPGGRAVTMTLTEARTYLGGAVQTLLGPGGVRFWSASALIARFARHGLRTVGAWHYGVVLFQLSLAEADE